MFTRDDTLSMPVQREKLPALLIIFSAIVPALAAALVIKQPKEVVAAVYSAYLAIIMVVVAGVCHRKKRRTGEVIAVAACVLFTGLFVIYAFITYRK